MNVFLSYSEANKTLADSLLTQLRRLGCEISNPAKDMAAGANLHKEIGKALEQSDAMVVLLTPDSVASPFVRSEIDYALSNPRFRNRLIPVMVRPTESVPWILEKLNQRVIRVSKDLSQTAGEIASALHVIAPETLADPFAGLRTKRPRSIASALHMTTQAKQADPFAKLRSPRKKPATAAK